MSRPSKTVARNGRLGRLIAFSARHDYEGTHTTPDGRHHRCRFQAANACVARLRWEAWRGRLDEERGHRKTKTRKGRDRT